MTEYNKELTAAQMLFEARTSGRRKREISTISKLLCIREEYLLALEKGKYEVIPEVVYILGFARNYAMELGLDPDEITTKIKRELGLIDETDGTVIAEKENIVFTKPKETKKSVSNGTGTLNKLVQYVQKHWKWFIGGLVALVLVIIGLSIFFSIGNDANVSNGDVVSSVATVDEPEYKQAVRERFGTENHAVASIIIQATSESWVKIEDARGNTVFSRVLVPGDVYYMPDGNKYKGTFGNAGGIDIWVDGKIAPKLGADHTRKSGVLMTPEVLIPTERPVTPAE